MANAYIFSYKQFNGVMTDMGWNDDTIDNVNDTAIISICNTPSNIADNPMTHWFKRNHRNVLNLDFDDTTFDDKELGIYSISEEQAKQIVDFYEKNISVENMVVHCEAGISRSAAVAVCFLDFLHMNGIPGGTLHENIAFHPNPKVERLLHQEFSKRNSDII